MIGRLKYYLPDHKKGCTGKVAHMRLKDARAAVHARFNFKGVILQAYDCNHCSGFHLTSRRISLWQCPALATSAEQYQRRQSFHHLKRQSKEIYCKDCGLHFLDAVMVSIEDKKVLMQFGKTLKTDVQRKLAQWIASSKCNWVTPMQKLALDSFVKTLTTGGINGS